jgi:hypothetical protein
MATVATQERPSAQRVVHLRCQPVPMPTSMECGVQACHIHKGRQDVADTHAARM